MRVALVACSSLKLKKAAPAAVLYSSPLFKKSRAWAERFCDEWRILSAKHGVVRPDDFLSTYDHALADMPLEEREAWKVSVGETLARDFMDGATFVWLAGGLYMGALRFIPRSGDYEHEEPMRGMQIGERLRWLNGELAKPEGKTMSTTRRRGHARPRKPKTPDGAHLVVRKDGVLCTICGDLDPVHMGDGTPLPSFLSGLEGCKQRHPGRPHQKVWGR